MLVLLVLVQDDCYVTINYVDTLYEQVFSGFEKVGSKAGHLASIQPQNCSNLCTKTHLYCYMR